MPRSSVRALAVPLPVLLAAPLLAQHGEQQSSDQNAPMYVAPASDEGRQAIASFELAEGLVADLVAAEPDVCNGVAFTIDGKGRFYVCETFRIGDGVFDTRSYMQWKDRDLALRTVAEREAKYREFLPKRLDDLSRRSERVRMLVDTNGDGVLDRSTVFAADFSELADGIVSGVLPVGDDVWVTNIPKLWRLRDTDGDGTADERTAAFDGFGVHTSLIGHDMHGLIVGPDRRLYFSIGDRGFHVETKDGTFDYPHEGAVLRCELDGSDLEVVHRGLRNPQELAFDKWGDLFTGDNNSDGGDKARLVQILPGADSGWRIGFQWLGDRGAWNREKMWHPRHPEQSAGIVPPIRNFADGPSGLTYDVGHGLPERFRDCFFLCDFRGGRSYSGVRTFRLSRRGAGYEVEDHDRLAWNVLATDVEFGPDGALYVFDWVNGWGKTGKGRIYRLRTPQMANDFQLRNTARLLADDLTKRPKAQLQALLAHKDRRVRQAAQFALIDQGSADALEAAARSRSDRIARLHGVWGLGVMLRRHGGDAKALLELCQDDDADVRAAAARSLGDARHAAAAGLLTKLLDDDNSRVRREAAFALARLRGLGGDAARKAVDALLALLRHDDDHDAVLRHAAVTALGALAERQRLVAAADDASHAVQRGVLLALARQGADEVARFLTHTDEQLRYEAARAIYDGPIPGAMQALAQLCYDDHADSERIDWRAINANRMLGQVEHGEALVHVAAQQDHPAKTRREALAVLAEWKSPHGQCRVGGNWRPCLHPDAELVAQRLAGALPQLLRDQEVAEAAAEAAASLGITTAAADLLTLVGNGELPPPARVSGLDALAKLDAPELQQALRSIDAKAPVALRKRAVALLSKTDPKQAIPVLASLLENGPLGERQAACQALGDIQDPAAFAVLKGWLARADKSDVPQGLLLDLLEAGEKHEPGLMETYDKVAALGGDPLAPFRMCLDGGDGDAGRKVFHDFEATRCTRCHTLRGSGGNAGPVLDGIASRLQKEQLLEALIVPSARIAEGFGTTTIELHNGGVLRGVITKDQDGGITIVDSEGKATDVGWDRIQSRAPDAESAMPKMGGALTKRQIRDLLAFLGRQK